MTEQTIIALATPIGKSAVAVIRMSGQDSIDIARKVFSPMPKQPNLLKVGTLKTEHFDEQAMCVYFVAPKSYTGENSVEFHCHGGMAIVSAVLDALIRNGARMAQNGEFSKRAFINGKQNLTNAEGIIEMIEAETQSGVKAGENLLNNRLGKLTIELQDKLTDLISATEVALDYPEEDLELTTVQQLDGELSAIIKQVTTLLDTASVGKIVKYGINVAIVGAPNVGKSSLLNALLGSDRAIVSNIAGTTRDTLTESVAYKDTKFNFVDTAGLRETADTIEAEGIKRAMHAVEQSDIVLNVVDNTDTPTQNFNKPTITVYNKCDTMSASVIKKLQQGKKSTQVAVISAKNNIGIEQLKEQIYSQFHTQKTAQDSLILTNARHIDCLVNVKNVLLKAYDELQNATLDCITVCLREAWDELGAITGTNTNQAIIDRIYSKFCLGK